MCLQLQLKSIILYTPQLTGRVGLFHLCHLFPELPDGLLLLLDHLRVPVTDTHCSNVMQGRTSALLQGRVLSGGGGNTTVWLYLNCFNSDTITAGWVQLQLSLSNPNTEDKEACMYVRTYLPVLLQQSSASWDWVVSSAAVRRKGPLQKS